MEYFYNRDKLGARIQNQKVIILVSLLIYKKEDDYKPIDKNRKIAKNESIYTPTRDRFFLYLIIF